MLKIGVVDQKMVIFPKTPICRKTSKVCKWLICEVLFGRQPWVAAQQQNSQPDEPDDLAQAKPPDQRIGQHWHKGENAHQAHPQAEDI